jgi:hypothetical protein
MSVIRPEVSALLSRWSEVIAAALSCVLGAWMMSVGGWVLWPVGLALIGAAGAWAAVAIRRMRFRRQVEQPGVILLDEGQLSYFGPLYGGVVALADLVEIRIGWRDESLEWRLRSRDGQMLRVPASAMGSDRLYDAFAVLPGIDMALLSQSLDDPPGAGVSRPLWVRPGLARLPMLVPPPPGAGSVHHDLS